MSSLWSSKNYAEYNTNNSKVKDTTLSPSIPWSTSTSSLAISKLCFEKLGIGGNMNAGKQRCILRLWGSGDKLSGRY